MIFKPYYYFETGCAAYLFGCGSLGKCAVVDAHEQDVDAYAAFAASKGMRITHVIDTHVHADHRSGGVALANKVGASYCLHESADVAFPFEPLRDGQEVELGNTRVKVLHTPGHTEGSTCFYLRREGALFSGDLLFKGNIGRADLPGSDPSAMAESLSRVASSLPANTRVYPGHGAETTIGAEIATLRGLRDVGILPDLKIAAG